MNVISFNFINIAKLNTHKITPRPVVDITLHLWSIFRIFLCVFVNLANVHRFEHLVIEKSSHGS